MVSAVLHPKPGERLVGFRLLFCAVNPYDPAGPLLVQDFLRSSKGLDG